MLVTSGTTGAGGESSGNSWKNRACCRGLQYTLGDAALPARDAEPGNLKQWWQQWTILTCLDSQRPRLALKMQFPGLMRINKSTSMKMMTMFAKRTMLSGTLVTVMTSWMKQHTQLVLPQMTQNFLNSLMGIWKTLMRPHLKCMHQQVAVFKKHVSFCLVLREPEVEREIISAERWRVSKPSWYTWHLAKTTDPHVPSLVLRCPRSGRQKLAQLVVDHITLLVVVLISACCVDKLEIRASECPNTG